MLSDSALESLLRATADLSTLDATPPSPTLSGAGKNKIWTQNEAELERSTYLHQDTEEGNVQKHHNRLRSPDSTPARAPSLSKSALSSTSPPMPSTPTRRTHVLFHNIEE
jgi:hypothetical protein